MKRRYLGSQSQAVRLPEYVRANADRVAVFRRDEEIILRETSINASAIFDAVSALPEDFMGEGRDDKPQQEREAL
ncbi:virulence factor [Methylomonas koyamae]|uniref:Virulence factor n=1 Tax=Methylomonas koyamae TaxID=702114 RepID=A0A177N4G4_9GAMM|nr:hypothetical protein [Methylomonas koyamae]OAI12099.1 virulence factor [Methylomonas koyamae]